MNLNLNCPFSDRFSFLIDFQFASHLFLPCCSPSHHSLTHSFIVCFDLLLYLLTHRTIHQRRRGIGSDWIGLDWIGLDWIDLLFKQLALAISVSSPVSSLFRHHRSIATLTLHYNTIQRFVRLIYISSQFQFFFFSDWYVTFVRSFIHLSELHGLFHSD